MRLLLLLALVSHAFAVEIQITDSEGKTAYLYSAEAKPDPGKTYWLVVGVHGVGGNGKGAMGLAGWANEMDDVIVLGPSFTEMKRDPAAPKPEGMPKDVYQMSGRAHESKLKALIAEVGKTWKLQPKIFLHGFSAGAQFAHRFAFKNPEMIAAVSAHSGGSWAKLEGDDEINPAAKEIPFILSCGADDQDRAGKCSAFAESLRSLDFDVSHATWAAVVHTFSPEAKQQTRLGLERVRADARIQRTGSLLFALDFDGANPLPDLGKSTTQEPAGIAVTARSLWLPEIGTIREQGTIQRTGAIQLQVNAIAGLEKWSGSVSTGPIKIRNTENDLAKLTLAFDLAASAAHPVTIRIESSHGEATGALEGKIFPPSPRSFFRHVLDLSEMKAAGEGKFDPLAPKISVTFSISSENDWPATAGHEIRIDNLSLAAPALHVSPSGDDKANDGSAEKPFATPKKALDTAKPGDIILLGEGVYDSAKAETVIKNSGTPAAWIVLKNHPGQRAVMKSISWNTLKIGSGTTTAISTDRAPSYIEIRGLTLEGNSKQVEALHKDDIGKPQSTTNGNGISVDGRFQTVKPHHVRIADCEIRDFPGGGVSVIHADRIQVERVHAYNNCKWMIYAGSGISIYQPFNFDNETGGHRILVRNNHTHHNACTQPWTATGKLSDGNGLIVDDTRNTQNKSANGIYLGGILLQSNLSHDNGGSGMHCFSSDHVDFINNTAANNNTVMDYGQLSVTRCGNVRVLNNILVAPADKPLNRVNGDFYNVFLSHNLLYGGIPGESVAGEHAIFADPEFSNAVAGDFTLKKSSPARGSAGAWEISPATYSSRGYLR